MENQKVVVVILRVKGKNNIEKCVPIGFKLDSDKIPNGLKQSRMHVNLIHINVENTKPIPAMIVSVGNDSKEIDSSYKKFCENVQGLSIPKPPSKIDKWIDIESVGIESISASSLKVLKQVDFDNFWKKLDFIKRREKRIHDQKNIPTIDLENESGPSQNTRSSFRPVKIKQEEGELNQSQEFNMENALITFKDNLQALRQLGDSLSASDVLDQFDQVSNVLETIVKHQENVKETFENNRLQIIKSEHHSPLPTNQTRQIPVDETVSEGTITMLEGNLPVLTKKYRKMLKSFPKKIEQREPTTVLTNLVKYCFPSHWILDVTMKGQRGRQSLISIWNYEDPLSLPPQGDIITGLGSSRLVSFIDHIMRQCGKFSYNGFVERSLIGTMSKAMHYARTKLEKKESVDWNSLADDSSTEDSDDDDESKDEEAEEVESESESASAVPLKKRSAFDSMDDKNDQIQAEKTDDNISRKNIQALEQASLKDIRDSSSPMNPFSGSQENISEPVNFSTAIPLTQPYSTSTPTHYNDEKSKDESGTGTLETSMASNSDSEDRNRMKRSTTFDSASSSVYKKKKSDHDDTISADESDKTNDTMITLEKIKDKAKDIVEASGQHESPIPESYSSDSNSSKVSSVSKSMHNDDQQSGGGNGGKTDQRTNKFIGTIPSSSELKEPQRILDLSVLTDEQRAAVLGFLSKK